MSGNTMILPHPRPEIGLGHVMLLSWPVPFQPELAEPDGDNLIVTLRQGFDAFSIVLEIHDYSVYLAEGEMFTLAQKLKRNEDIEFLIDRYDVRIQPGQDDLPACIYVDAFKKSLAHRAWQLVQFCQAVLDYEAGRADYTLELDRLKATIRAIEAERDGRA